jgi:maleylacetoacetate isomerase
MITLYDYWRSSASYRVRIALNLLRLPYTAVPVNLLTGDQKAPANLARNPQGLVPTLDIDGVQLTQSLAIIEYLNDTHGGLLPDDAMGRARVRALSYAVAMEIAPVCNLSVRNHVANLGGGAFTADDWQTHYIGAGLAALERMLAAPQTGLFCHGDAVSMADLCLVPQIYNAQRVGLDVASWPTIARIVDRLESIPAVQAAHPDKVKP